MTEVVSIRFKACGKSYFFDPAGIKIEHGDKLVVETAKGLELVECIRAAHMVEDTAVVPPLRPVIRVATAEDLRMDALNRQREKDAFDICAEKIKERELDMKLVAVECSFEGNKTTFFFTSDGRVDFRELVKDLAAIFHNRIELRQIGVRDEAKMVGGIGICGRPFCCSQFLNDFAPVSTKMAKVQSLSLNPAKISGCCGRLMCCLRYEEDAYEDLIKSVPKQGAYVETPDGYGVAAQINLLRQMVKVKLDSDTDENLHVYKASEVAAVPGGRPKDGEIPAHVLFAVSEEDEPEVSETAWSAPSLFADAEEDENELKALDEEPSQSKSEENPVHSRRNNRNNRNQRNSKNIASGYQQGTPETLPEASQASPVNKFDRKYKRNNSEAVKENGKTELSEGSSSQETKKRPNKKRRYHSNKKSGPQNSQQVN